MSANVLILAPGLFDKGGIARYGRAQVSAVRDGFGADNVRVLSVLGRMHDDLEEPFEVDFCGTMPPSIGSRALFATHAARLARACRPSLILTQHLNLGPLALALGKLHRVPVVQTVYGRELWSPITRARREALKRTPLISDCHNSAEYCVSAGLTKQLPHVVWDCVELDRYRPEAADPEVWGRYGVPDKTGFRVLFLGRLHEHARYKGSARLIQLAARLPDGFDVVLAGKGDDVDNLKRMARDHGVSDRVFFTGPILEEDMPKLYGAADAFFLVSEVGEAKGEGIPLTPLEALACGTPVLVGDQDGSRETLTPTSGGGRTLSPSDTQGQLAYLSELASDPGLHAEERVRARARAEAAFGYPAFRDNTVAFLNSQLRDTP